MIAAELDTLSPDDTVSLRAATARLPNAIATMLGQDDTAREAAAILAGQRRIFLASAGPNHATAREGALKLKESCFITAEGLELETTLHGGLQAMQAGDLCVVIVAHGPAVARAADLLRALQLIDVLVVLIADQRIIPDLPMRSGRELVFPFAPIPEPLSPLPAVIPLQLLAAHTSAILGTNPDAFRGDQPVFKQVNASYTF